MSPNVPALDSYVVMHRPVRQFKLLEYQQRLFDAFFTLNYSFTALEQNKEKLVDHQMQGVPAMAADLLKNAWTGPAEQITTIQTEMIEKMRERNAANVDRYLSNLINLTVAFLCSALEISVNDILGTIFQGCCGPNRTLLDASPTPFKEHYFLRPDSGRHVCPF